MNNQNYKDKLYKIIFRSDTPAGKGFDILLIISIFLSVTVVFLDSVEYYNEKYSNSLYALEWVFTIFFTELASNTASANIIIPIMIAFGKENSGVIGIITASHGGLPGINIIWLLLRCCVLNPFQ